MEGVTRESLRPLLELQRVDSAVDRLTQRKADLPEQRELDELAEQRDAVVGQRAERQAVLDGVVREQNKLEAEIEQIDAKIKQDSGRLYGGDVTSPKELSSIQAELDSLRRRKNHLEDQELEVMERREEVEKEVAELTGAFDGLGAKIEDATARRDRATVEIDSELENLTAERAQLRPTLHDEVLELYDEQRAKRGGVAVGALEGGVCRGCNLPLSPMAREEIRTSDTAIIRCENCRRLLVVV